MPNQLEQSIAKTIVWFSLFKKPITTFELWKWLFEPDRAYSLLEVENELENSKMLAERIRLESGYIVWDSKRFPSEEDIKKRHSGYRDSFQKYNGIKNVVRYLTFVPGVVAIGAVNSLGMWNTRRGSDIDFLILVHPGLIWTARLFSVLPFALLKRRPKKGKVFAGKQSYPLCFSFFISTNTLCLEGASLDGGDPYLAYWITQITPLYDSGCWFETMSLANSWSMDILPNAKHCPKHKLLCLPKRKYRQVFSGSFLLFEPLFRFIQKYRLPLSIRLTRAKDRSIVIDNDILKFHETDRRANFRQGFEERLRVFWENG